MANAFWDMWLTPPTTPRASAPVRKRRLSSSSDRVTRDRLPARRSQSPWSEQYEEDVAASDASNQNAEDILAEFSGSTSLAPLVDPFDAQGRYLEGLARSGALSGFDFGADPFFQQLQNSIAATLSSPDVISQDEANFLKGQAVDRILGTRRTALQDVREDAVRRGALDSGAQAALSAQTGQQAGRDISAAERQVDIDRALAREQNRARAQQVASALTGQTLQAGLANQQFGLQAAGQSLQAGQLALGQGALDVSRFGAELGKAGTLAEIGLGKDFPVRDVLSQFFDDRAMQQLQEATANMEETERNAFWGSILTALFQGGLGIGIPKLLGS